MCLEARSVFERLAEGDFHVLALDLCAQEGYLSMKRPQTGILWKKLLVNFLAFWSGFELKDLARSSWVVQSELHKGISAFEARRHRSKVRAVLG